MITVLIYCNSYASPWQGPLWSTIRRSVTFLLWFCAPVLAQNASNLHMVCAILPRVAKRQIRNALMPDIRVCVHRFCKS